MSAKILFTHSYFYKFDEKQWKAAQPYPPYGTMVAAAWMRQAGYDVHLFDAGLSDGASDIFPLIDAIKPDYCVIYDDGFNYLTKMCLTRMREAAFEIAQYARKNGCTVMVNSSDSSDHYEKYLDNGADYVLKGEGEMTLLELVNALKNGAPVELIQGIYLRETAGKTSYTGPRPVLHDLDVLPDPAWDLVDVAAYKKIWMERWGYFALNIATTRGCPYKCNWCAKPIYGNRYNSRSPERVASEIEHLINTYGVHYFWMADDIFGLKPHWVQGFRDQVLAKKLNFQYKIQSRVDLLLKEDAIEALVASGLRQVWVGAESGSQKILDAMDKGTTTAEIAEATALLKKCGVEVCFFLQFGYLGETRDDIESTIKMVETLLPFDIGISVSYPLPGTKFYDIVQSKLGEKQNWTVSDDLDMMYPATYSPAFYKRLHRLVHKRFRKRQGLVELQTLLSGKRPSFRRIARLAYYIPAGILDTWRLNRLQKQPPHA